ncbi:hypothetical protein Chor_011594 [Crotalus horridus]
MPHHRGYLRLLAAFCLTFLFLTFAASYKPVIVVHGLFDSPSDFQILLNFINETHPGTNVSVVDLFDRTESLKSLWMQVEGFRQVIYPIMQNAVDGVHLYCYSQDTKYLKWLFPHYMKSNLYRLCYTQLGQDVSICNYWNDPHHRDLYLNNSNFLAVLNDERLHPNASAWKRNLLRIRKLILIGGPDDGVIMPWESSMFAFYDVNETVREMTSQPVYLLDTFGLKTLHARGDIVFCKMANVSHTNWHANRTVYDTCIAKWLT